MQRITITTLCIALLTGIALIDVRSVAAGALWSQVDGSSGDIGLGAAASSIEAGAAGHHKEASHIGGGHKHEAGYGAHEDGVVKTAEAVLTLNIDNAASALVETAAEESVHNEVHAGKNGHDDAGGAAVHGEHSVKYEASENTNTVVASSLNVSSEASTIVRAEAAAEAAVQAVSSLSVSDTAAAITEAAVVVQQKEETHVGGADQHEHHGYKHGSDVHGDHSGKYDVSKSTVAESALNVNSAASTIVEGAAAAEAAAEVVASVSASDTAAAITEAAVVVQHKEEAHVAGGGHEAGSEVHGDAGHKYGGSKGRSGASGKHSEEDHSKDSSGEHDDSSAEGSWEGGPHWGGGHHGHHHSGGYHGGGGYHHGYHHGGGGYHHGGSSGGYGGKHHGHDHGWGSKPSYGYGR